jgi:hypothetical protein
MMMRIRIASFVAVLMLLSAQPCLALDVNIDLNYGELFGVYRNAESGWRIEGSFEAVNGIEFFICDAGNYSLWIDRQTPILYEHNEQATAHTFNVTVPYNAVWYVIFSNAYITSNNSLEAEIRYIDQFGVEQTQVSEVTENLISTPLVVGFIVAGMVLSIIGIWWARRREPTPAVRYDEILSKPS